MKYSMGIDCGTGGLRVGIFTLQGKMVTFASEGVTLYTPTAGYVEQDPMEWWEALCKASRRAISESGISPADIVGISCSATVSTVLFTDADMKPLRPALMWCDVRATKQAKRIAQSGDEALKYNGYGSVSAEWGIPKILWVKENEPEIFEKSAHICECHDYLLYQMTGELAASRNAVTIRWYYDNCNGGWPLGLYKKIGLADAVEKFPKRVLGVGELWGYVSKKAAEKLGIAAGIPVGAGACDAYCATLALGVVRPGSMAMIMGSSHLQYTPVEQPFYDKGIFGAFPDAMFSGLYAMEAGQAATGSLIEWFRKKYCGHLEREAKENGKNLLSLLNEQAETLPVGAENLLMLDYFQGNRTPRVDSDVRGLIYGLTLKHTPAHIYRAIIESICYATEDIIRTFERHIPRPEAMYVCGGPTKSSFWVQAHADVSNIPLYIPECIEAPCFGAAMIGAVTGKEYDKLEQASDTMVRFVRCIEPRREYHEEYQFYFEKYRELYSLLCEWMHEVTLHKNSCV